MIVPEQTVETISVKFNILKPLFDERLQRAWAASEAQALGYGGITAVAKATGLNRATIGLGIEELERGETSDKPHRIRRQGGGRKALIEQDPTLLEDLDKLVDPTTRGDPTSPLRWTCKSLRTLAEKLVEMGHLKIDYC